MTKRQFETSAHRAMMQKAIKHEAEYRIAIEEYGQFEPMAHAHAEVTNVLRALLVTELKYISLPEYEAAIEHGVEEYMRKARQDIAFTAEQERLEYEYQQEHNI